jgi:hypothetical protein
MELLGFIYDFIIPPIFLMYIPKKTKFKKEQKKISFKKVERPFEINKLQFGSVGLKSGVIVLVYIKPERTWQGCLYEIMLPF